MNTGDTDKQLIPWVMLSLVPGLGSRGAVELVRALGSPAEVFTAPQAVLAAQSISREAVWGIGLAHLRPEAEQILLQAAAQNIRILCPDDGDYPEVLKEIFDPPIILYVRGSIQALNRPGIAIVGTRRPTPYGMEVSGALAAELAKRGLVVVSGLARGIDTAAHRGALAGEGTTVAVLGCGVDVMYPRENRKLSMTILEQGGALVSEFPLGTFPAPQNFPIRNRIISGLSLGAVVVEASEYSGSLITARSALEQNRDVFAVPGCITSRTSVGPNALIQQGAKLVQSWRDVVEELPHEVRLEALREPTAVVAPALPLLDTAETELLQQIRIDVAVHVDELCIGGRSKPREVHELLLNLELKGYIKQLPGKNFVRREGDPGSTSGLGRGG